MSLFSRWLVYIGCFGAAFALGSYVLPSPHGPLGQKNAKSRTAVRKFWSDQVAVLAQDATPAKKQQSMLELMDKLTKENGDFPNVLPSVQQDAFALPIFAALWSQVDPDSLFKHLAESGGLGNRENQILAGHLLMEQATVDPAAAEAAASRLRLPGQPFDAFKPVGLSLLRQNVKKGIAFLAKHPGSITDAEVMQELRAGDLQAPNWEDKTIDARITWLDGLPAAPWRDRTIEDLYARWAVENPASVLKAAQQRGATAQHILPAVRAWLQSNPEAAQQFFRTEARDEVKAALSVALAEKLAAEAPQAAWDFAHWEIAGQPRAQASQRVLAITAQADPAQAARWISEMPPTPWRATSLQEIAAKWNEKDPAAAQEWLASLPMADQTLLKQP